MSEERNLTDKEEKRSATFFDNIWFTSKYNQYHALRGETIFYCENPLGPWIHLATDEPVTEDEYFKLFPGLSHVTEHQVETPHRNISRKRCSLVHKTQALGL
jgi:hypothetical protein